MREIKFRAWHEEDKQMIYPLQNNTLTTKDLIDRFPNYIMQFTGLYDKNGVEIYEGDIVSMHSKILHIDDIRNIKYWEEKYVNFSSSEMEVIGNVYQNPELLEEE